jgi:hypothetical protein
MAIKPVHIENEIKASFNLPLDESNAKQLVFDQ